MAWELAPPLSLESGWGVGSANDVVSNVRRSWCLDASILQSGGPDIWVGATGALSHGWYLDGTALGCSDHFLASIADTVSF